MINYILGALWTLLSQFGRWFLDLLTWVLEFFFELVNEFFDFIASFFTDLLVEAIEYIAPHIPSDVMSTILSTYTWLEYVDDWVPLSFGLKLVVVYFNIKLVLTVFKLLLRVIPFI